MFTDKSPVLPDTHKAVNGTQVVNPNLNTSVNFYWYFSFKRFMAMR